MVQRGLYDERRVEVRSGRERRRPTLPILIVILVLLWLGELPTWPHSRSWGYYPSGGLGIVLLILGVPLLTGRL